MDGKWKRSAADCVKEEEIRIRLEEQNHSFAVDSNHSMKGELRIVDGKVVLTGQNLRAAKGGYKLFFIGRKSGKSVYKAIGSILPDTHGKIEFQCTINQEDVDGEGTDLSCFYIFMVAAMGQPIVPVLKGDLAKEQVSTGEQKNINHTKEKKDYNAFYRQYILEKIEELEQQRADFVDISPFDDAWITDNWKRVKNLSCLPIASVGAEKQIKRYGHFIYGATREHFYIGVPGRHNKDEWPDRGVSGFLLWQAIRTCDEYGYWAMVIERKTGIITEIP